MSDDTPKHPNIPLEFSKSGAILITTARKLFALGLKYCPSCQSVKSLDQFYKRLPNKKNAYSAYCSKCATEQSLEYVKNNPEVVKAKTERYARERAARIERESTVVSIDGFDLVFRRNGTLSSNSKADLHEIGLRYCPTCRSVLSESDFYEHARNSDGLYRRCKTCHNKAASQWAKENPETVNRLTRQSYQRNRLNWVSTRQRYKGKNRKSLREYRKRQYRDNQEKEREQNRIWSKNNPEKIKALAHNRRTRLLNAEGSHTADDLKLMWEQQGGRCAYCGCELTPEYRHLDHVIPLSRGGSNWPSNLAWSCPPCNLSKNNRLLEEWLDGS